MLIIAQPCQSLFVAPCSHVWHFKCIRPILNDHKTYPQFLCPNCRAVTDLEAEADDLAEQWDEEDSETDSRLNELQAPNESTKVIPGNGVNVENLINKDDADLASSTRQMSLLPSSNRQTLQSTQPTFEAITQRPIEPDTQAILSDDDSPSELLETGEEWTQRASTPMNAVTRPLTPQVSTESQITDGPLTPRNDAGPFVFDGSAGRAAGGRISAALAAGNEVRAAT